MVAGEAPQPPYVLLFEEVAPGALPLVILVDDRPAVPLFGSEVGAVAFADAADFGTDLEPVEVSKGGLIQALESVREHAGYVALDPPPATRGGMRVRMGDLGELIEALQTSPEDDLFGLGGSGV
ncbi:MAG: hypothetical protein M3157_06020 [Actinomycetota bacterium]|nr:hypothetical protein [Actinomycetota bacterium]